MHDNANTSRHQTQRVEHIHVQDEGWHKSQHTALRMKAKPVASGQNRDAAHRREEQRQRWGLTLALAAG
eukprot:1147416-Pelagomonas_calceolata.AAC.10